MYSMADEIICSLYEKRKPAEVVVEEAEEDIAADGENGIADSVVNDIDDDVSNDSVAEE